MTLGSWLDYAKRQLSNVGISSPALEAQLLASKGYAKSRAEILARTEWPAIPVLDPLLERRLRGEPLAYILGNREFYGRVFQVSPAVLIPRQDTETLIEAWMSFEQKLPPNAKILDFGTGSGCIGITLKLEQPQLDVTLSDISQDALEVARENAQNLGANVKTVKSDRFIGLAKEKFDAIVTNPPYIGLSEPLAAEVRDFEPKDALFSGESGLEMYEELAGEAHAHLEPGGILIAEVGYSQSLEVRNIFESRKWKYIKSYRDLSGIERVLAFGMPEAAQLAPEQ